MRSDEKLFVENVKITNSFKNSNIVYIVTRKLNKSEKHHCFTVKLIINN